MRLSIATRIFLGFAAVLTVFGAVSSFAVWRMHAVGEEIRLVSEGYLPLTKVAAQLETFHKNKQRDTDRLLEETDPRTQRILIKLARLYFPRIVREKLDQGRQLVADTRRLAGPEEQQFLDDVERRFAELAEQYDAYDASAAVLFAALENEGVADPAHDQRGRELKRIERRIDRSLKLLSHTLEGRIQERVREAQAQERRSSWAIVGFSIGAIALGLLATILSQRLLSPIRTLTEAAVRIGRGDLSAEVPTTASNEIGVLAREFNQMAASLRAREKELQEKQEALVRAEKLATIGRMAAQITHEIRNPLSSIGLNAELLADELDPADPESAEARRLCAAIAREVDRLAEITEEYLRFARLPKPVLAREDVGELLRDLVAFVKPELEEAGIRVELDLSDGLEARVDENQIRQALLNLVRNAREAMPGGGTLRLQARPAPDGGVEVRIADTGIGMRPEDLARIFDPFFTTKDRGTGLGLSLTQQIVAQHGGSLHCESEWQRGTTFTLQLPRASA